MDERGVAGAVGRLDLDVGLDDRQRSRVGAPGREAQTGDDRQRDEIAPRDVAGCFLRCVFVLPLLSHTLPP